MQLKPSLHHIKPYIPGLYRPDMIKLSANENLRGCSPHISEALRDIPLHTYPYQYTDLIQALATHTQQAPDRLILGNGSDELLLLAGLCYLSPETHSISADQTFSQYESIAHLTGAAYTAVPLTHNQYDLTAMLQAIQPNTRVIFIANPNNPTGMCVLSDDLVAFLNQVPQDCLVILDEAYHEYTTGYLDTLALPYPNLLITRTFSKIYGLAALRLGYAIGPAPIIADLMRAKQPFNANAMALTAGIIALKDHAFITDSLAEVSAGRARITAMLDDLRTQGTPVAYCTSVANFLLIDLPVLGREAVAYFMNHGILVRDLASFGRPQAIRVTIGLPEHTDLFCDLFRDFIQTLS